MKDERDVHTEHCCAVHGCKYGDRGCSVKTGAKAQSYTCERCDYALESYNVLKQEYEKVSAIQEIIKYNKMLAPHGKSIK